MTGIKFIFICIFIPNNKKHFSTKAFIDVHSIYYYYFLDVLVPIDQNAIFINQLLLSKLYF